jgi:hypothetical protein
VEPLTLRSVRIVLLSIAAIALVVTPVIGLVPVHAKPLAGIAPPGAETVNCGSPFASTRWSSDDGCEGPVLSRFGLVATILLIALASGAIGLVLLFTEARRGL